MKCQPGEKPNWAFGNPLTFHSLLGKHSGTARWAYQEGAQGVLEKGYALLRYKRWFKLLTQARVETAMVYFIQHALAREQRRRAAARAAKPPQALPTPGVAGKKAATNISPSAGVSHAM